MTANASAPGLAACPSWCRLPNGHDSGLRTLRVHRVLVTDGNDGGEYLEVSVFQVVTAGEAMAPKLHLVRDGQANPFQITRPTEARLLAYTLQRNAPAWLTDGLLAAADVLAEARGDQPSFMCPRCCRDSYHPDDVANRYCGACHTFNADRA
ncbi:hypothetical protein [Actinomadura flavalba]|uniref:hypothetical protein n=1 Tax=Actinomadura flavalba TaxID=1120938 RepID=UPI00039B4B79|nr:hypothetical protein [Actinomadura flavalba]